MVVDAAPAPPDPAPAPVVCVERRVVCDLGAVVVTRDRLEGTGAVTDGRVGRGTVGTEKDGLPVGGSSGSPVTTVVVRRRWAGAAPEGEPNPPAKTRASNPLTSASSSVRTPRVRDWSGMGLDIAELPRHRRTGCRIREA
jgi:hypothetical protein